MHTFPVSVIPGYRANLGCPGDRSKTLKPLFLKRIKRQINNTSSEISPLRLFCQVFKISKGHNYLGDKRIMFSLSFS